MTRIKVYPMTNIRGSKPNINQCCLKGENYIAFQSYDSLIAVYKDGILTFGCNWDYSSTTLRYLYVWLNEIYGTFEDDFTKSKNKHVFLQNCIDSGKIKYDGGMK